MIKLSIITVTFNAANTVADCLDCVRNQSTEVEHILIDGMSQDNTMAIVKRHGDHLTHIVSEADRGIYDAMNKGLQLAKGDVIGILNADDFYPDTNTLGKVKELFTDPDIDACYGDLLYVDNTNSDKIVRNWRSGSYTPEKFYWGWMPPHPTFFVRRLIYEKYGNFNLELGSAADYEIMVRFLVKERIKAVYLPEVLVKMRTGGISNASLKNRFIANRMDRKAWAVNGLRPYPWTMWLKPVRKVGQWFCKSNGGNGNGP